MENNHYEELLHSLPDYITGELDDENLRGQIGARLLTDSSFREEFDSLKSTMNFVRETELQVPSEVYFANLQANILSKVHTEKETHEVSFLGKLAGYWKVVVPALTVCVVLFIYMRNINTTQLPVSDKKPQTIISDTPVSKTGIGTGNISSENTTEDNYIFLDEIFSDENESIVTNQKRIRNGNSIPSAIAVESAPVTDYTGTGTIFGRDEDMLTQEEYDNLPIEEQIEILQSLKEKTF